MYLSSAIAALLSVLPAITVAGASIPTALEKRGGHACFAHHDGIKSHSPFPKSDLAGLQNTIQNAENANPEMIYFSHGSVHQWTSGEAMLCIQNKYLTQNTHLKWGEVKWALGYINDQCCAGSEADCLGGWATAHGDSGLAVEVGLFPKAYGCG